MINWTKFGELIVPGIVVGVFMLVAQLVVEIYGTRQKLVSEEMWRAKRDAFVSAIRLVDQYLSASKWSGPDIPSGYKPSGIQPAAFEINSVYAQLMLTATSPEIPERFIHFFGHGASPQSRGEFIILLRKELFSSVSPIKPEDVPWIF